MQIAENSESQELARDSTIIKTQTIIVVILLLILITLFIYSVNRRII